ncbi:hypothetical protein B0I35DRAFT_20262 [Stachybotrys elegans]|uniref:Uncharacterized protein n=1 Tax=Stachybotrys elegans TaxID=80388 RepID=A0A8K0T7F4_9HYPO|nr:hypothetical protein B0I35DRAFT_20262 [Stachybotrys elegans]
MGMNGGGGGGGFEALALDATVGCLPFCYVTKGTGRTRRVGAKLLSIVIRARGTRSWRAVGGVGGFYFVGFRQGKIVVLVVMGFVALKVGHFQGKIVGYFFFCHATSVMSILCAEWLPHRRRRGKEGRKRRKSPTLKMLCRLCGVSFIGAYEGFQVAQLSPSSKLPTSLGIRSNHLRPVLLRPGQSPFAIRHSPHRQSSHIPCRFLRYRGTEEPRNSRSMSLCSRLRIRAGHGHSCIVTVFIHVILLVNFFGSSPIHTRKRYLWYTGMGSSRPTLATAGRVRRTKVLILERKQMGKTGKRLS